MIVACLNVYNGLEQQLYRALRSVEGVADRIVAVDGRYAQYPGESAISTDGTLKVLKEAGAEVILPPNNQPWKSELVKRNAYLEAVETGDYILVMDADYELHNGHLLKEMVLDKDCYRIRLILQVPENWGELSAKNPDAYRRYPMEWRLVLFYRKVKGLHYRGTHYWLWDGNDEIYSDQHMACGNYSRGDVPDMAYLKHWVYFCGDRSEAKKQYYRWLTPDEQKFVNAWRTRDKTKGASFI